MVRYVKNEGRPALGFAVESEESDESSDDEPLSDQPSLATLVSENPSAKVWTACLLVSYSR